jgi:hypothetical protein
MNVKEFKRLIHEVLDERSHAVRGPRKKQTRKLAMRNVETSKALILFASIMYALTWVVAVYSWFDSGSLPDELMKYATYLYGAALAIYGGKSAYENRAKIEYTYEESMRE